MLKRRLTSTCRFTRIKSSGSSASGTTVLAFRLNIAKKSSKYSNGCIHAPNTQVPALDWLCAKRSSNPTAAKSGSSPNRRGFNILFHIANGGGRRMTAQPFRFLLVEDNPADALLTKEALMTSNIAHVLDVATD